MISSVVSTLSQIESQSRTVREQFDAKMYVGAAA